MWSSYVRTVARSVLCPECGQRAVITLYEDPDERGKTEGHRVEFRCIDSSHEPGEPELLRLWAAARLTAARSEPAG